MKLYVPTNGDKLRLTSEWTFTIYNEWCGRNNTLLECLKVSKVKTQRMYSRDEDDTYMDYPQKSKQTLPVGTVLQVDRVYIRKFNATSKTVDDDYDSITFQVIGHPEWKLAKGRKTHCRFWVKLRDVNTIEFEHAAPPRWSVEDD